LNNLTEIKIFLTANDLNAGDDIISILAQQQLRRNIVSAFNTLNTGNISETPVLSVDQYMQGRISGMHVTNRSGDPAGGAVSFMRGVNSLNATNQPLYIIDGIPIIRKGIFGSNLDGFEYNPLLGVNTLDISKTTVIKDPTVTAAYGSKASNGLVLIETLDPSATQTVIELDLRAGYSLAPSNLIPQMNAGQHKTLVSEVLFSSGLEEEFVREQYPNLFLIEGEEGFINYQHNTRWQDLIFSDAAFTNLNINVKGGDEIARYGLSFGYINGDGVIKTTGYDGYSLRFVSMLNIFTWLKMNAGVALSYNNSLLKESAKVSETSPILTSLAKSPMLNPYQYDEEGQQLSILANVDELGVSNPQAVIDNYEAKNNNFNFTSTLGFNATINENMLVNSNFGINYNVLKEQLFMPNKGMELYYNDEAINVSKATNNSLKAFYNNTYFNYNRKFGEHIITSTTGVNIMNNIFEYDWGLTKNAHENDEYRMLQDGTNNLREIGGANRTWNWLSFYESVTYSYQDKYMASASLSLDGSSRVGDNAVNTIKLGGVPFGLFYSAGLAWRLSNESFLKDKSALEELKLRLTYGRSGNDDIGEANATKYYQAVKFRETSGLYPATLLNDELTYETVSQLNAGLDLALWGNRLAASVDLYQSNTSNMLIYAPLKAYFGYDFRPENGGKMKNTGIDANFFYRAINMPDFKWDVQVSYSTVKNEVTEIKGDKLVTPVAGAEIVNLPGEQANSFYGYIYEGVYSTNEAAESRGLLNNKYVPYQGGDAIYKDISGPNGSPDGIINSFDKTVIGSAMPVQWGGISNTFTYKRWALNAFVQFVTGNEIFNYVRYKNESMTGIENQSTKVLDRWQYEGQETMIPRALYEDLVGNSAFSTRWIEDGSYLRLKNVSLSYTIPNEFLTFKNAKFYISASNVFVLSKYLGYDPEFSYSSSHITQGIDYGLTPQPRQFVVGIKLGL
jgi:TonB-linked SusC/RagA family outer membrane protein